MSDPKYKYMGHPAVRTLEECSELIQALCKAQRFGWLSKNPIVGITNWELCKKEITDVLEVVTELLGWMDQKEKEGIPNELL